MGYAALYSAGGGAEPYASRHVLRFAFGLMLMLCIALADIRFIARLSWPAYVVGVALLVLVAHMGHVGKGAQRWIELGGMQWQPSEFMKLALVMALAAWFHQASWERMGNPLFLIPPAIAVLVPVGLILKEPNLGTALITAVVGASVFLGAGRALVEDRRRARGARRGGATRLCASARLSARPDRPPSSTPRATRSAPATTSSSRRSRSAPAACGARGSCRARRAT